MKIYEGVRDSKSGETVVTVNGQPLGLRLDLRNHSPTGFEWGYNGSGPAQLALAVCADASGDDETALRVYQLVKEKLFAHVMTPRWVYSQMTVLAAVNKSRKEIAAEPEQTQ